MDFYDEISRQVKNADITLSDIVQYFFAGAISLVVILNSLPIFTSKVYAYGKNDAHTTTPTSPNTTDTLTSAPKQQQPEERKDDPKTTPPATTTTTTFSRNPLMWPVELLTKLRVPHSWFWHFYALSLAVQTFWFVQLLTRGRVLQFFLDNLSSDAPLHKDTYSIGDEPIDITVQAGQETLGGGTGQRGGKGGTQSFDSALLCILCMMFQSARRLYETIFIQKSSNSGMGLTIYFSGISFYTMMGFATWCDAIPAIRNEPPLEYMVGPFSLVRPPRFKTFIAIPLFLLASGCQHDAHSYFANLKKYTLPKPEDHLLFRCVLCPNYTAECLIYIALAITGSGDDGLLGFLGSWNRALGFVVVFVVANQAATAVISRKWYIQKFGRDKVAGRAGMIPGLL